MSSTQGLLAFARYYALRAHGAQRYGWHPYLYHLDQVVAILAPYGLQAQVIGYLHDIVEDTDISIAQLERRFGNTVAQAVVRLTDPPLDSRKARKQIAHRVLAATPETLEIALIVKAADRLANLRQCCRTHNRKKLRAYLREYDAFRASAYRPDLCEPLWQEIDALIHQGGQAMQA